MKLKDIMLKNIIRIDNYDDYRLHFAAACDGHEPLDVDTDSFERGMGWQKSCGGNDCFPAKYIISFMKFYPKPGLSLFGGIFEVTGRHWELVETDPSNFYDIQFVEDYSEYIGRLIIETPTPESGNHILTLDRYDSLKVLAILPAAYGYNVSSGDDIS